GGRSQFHPKMLSEKQDCPGSPALVSSSFLRGSRGRGPGSSSKRSYSPMISARIILVVASLALSTGWARAADWKQWRGPDRSDVSAEKGLLATWPQDGPRQLWTFTNAGSGYSGFSVADGKLFTMGTRGDTEIVIALEAAKGTELWT